MNIKFNYNKNDFKDCSGAVKVSDEEIQKRIDRICRDLSLEIGKAKEPGYYFICSGNTYVIGFIDDEDGDGVLDNVRIFVCKDFEEAEGWINKDSVFEKMDWLEAEEEDKLYDLSKEELIEIIRRDIPYNPRREV